MTQFELFFQEPNDFDKKQQEYSTLFLLRRDILMSFGVNPNDYSKINYQVLFPGTMAIMAGIDLLSKFCYTDVNITGNYSADRFKKFVATYIDNQNQEILYQLRNSLLHSFGLYSEDRSGKIYNFTLNQSALDFITSSDGRNYSISVSLLLDKFEQSVRQYQQDVLADINLKNNFNLMFPKYGCIGIK